MLSEHREVSEREYGKPDFTEETESELTFHRLVDESHRQWEQDGFSGQGRVECTKVQKHEHAGFLKNLTGFVVLLM